MPTNEKNFCIGPWSEIRISPNGDLNYCHRSDWPSQGELGYYDNISTQDLDSYFTGPTATQVRNQLLDGSSVKGCQPCYDDEKKIEFSFRRRRNIQMAIFPNDDFAKSLKESSFSNRISSNYKPLFYNISTSNLCNLGCVMCSEKFSSRLASEFKKIGIQRYNDSHKHPSVLLDWSQDNILWEKFMQHILSNDQIVCVHFQGGEPFLHQRVMDFIDRCIEGNHVNFHFTTVTNGTIYDEVLIEKLKKFRTVQIEISLENTKKSNDYVRYPSDTTEVVNNIKKYSNHISEKFDIVVRSVPQLLTVLDYDSLLEFCLESDLIVDSNIIHTPNFFGVNLLPQHLKDLAASQLTKFISNTSSEGSFYNSINVRNRGYLRQNLADNAKMIMTAMNQPLAPNSHKLVSDCRGYLQKLDTSRKISLHNYCPEIADWLYD